MKGEVLMVGSLAGFSIVEGKPTTFKFYSAEGVETRKVKENKIGDFVRENVSKVSVRPASEHFTNFKDFDLFEYDMENDGEYHDISIRGLGWISFVARGQTIRVMLPHGVAVKESLSKIRK